MVLIQFTINTMEDKWTTKIAIISFAFSLFQVVSLTSTFFYTLHCETIGPIFQLREYIASNYNTCLRKDWIVGNQTSLRIYSYFIILVIFIIEIWRKTRFNGFRTD
jgi:hypothetical protein